jgi:hypothetical protein
MKKSLLYTVKIIDGSGVCRLTLTIANGLIKKPSLAATKFNLEFETMFLF